MNTGHALSTAMSVLPDPVLARMAAEELTAPCFHLVTGGKAPAHVRHLFRCPNVRQFEQDLDRLLRGKTPISLQDLYARATTGRALPRRPVFVSFDDGMREMAEIVAPLCRRKGVPVTFFLATGFLDNESLFFRHKASILVDRLRNGDSGNAKDRIGAFFRRKGAALEDPADALLHVGYREARWLDECADLLSVDFDAYLRADRPYLTGAQVADLLAQGFSIGAHSVDHPLFSELSLKEQLEQTFGSLEHLSSHFGNRIASFAFPFVSAGVGMDYYEATLGAGRVDMLFGIGSAPPRGYPGRVIERFGVESKSNASAVSAWRERARQQTKGRLRSSLLKKRS